MRVTFYRNTGNKRTVRKNLQLVGTVDCWIKDNCGMLEPTIRISRDALSTFSGVNYFYIDTFGRYYDVTEDIAMTGDFIEITGKVDPLYSNISGILNISCLVLRQEHKYNKYFQDANVPIRTTKSYVYKRIGTLPSVTTYILTVDGGKR